MDRICNIPRGSSFCCRGVCCPGERSDPAERCGKGGVAGCFRWRGGAGGTEYIFLHYPDSAAAPRDLRGADRRLAVCLRRFHAGTSEKCPGGRIHPGRFLRSLPGCGAFHRFWDHHPVAAIFRHHDHGDPVCLRITSSDPGAVL